jgi:hypothetical protein
VGLRGKPNGSVGSSLAPGGDDNPGTCVEVPEGGADRRGNPSKRAFDRRGDRVEHSHAAEPKTHCGLCGKGPQATPDDFDCPYLK